MILTVARAIQKARTWQLVILSILGAEIIVAAMTTLIHLAWQQPVSMDILAIGFVDAFAAAAIVAPLIIHFIRQAAQLAGQNETLQDEIVARRSAEDQLRESEDRLRSFVEHTSEWILMTDEAGTIVEWNPGAVRTTGLKREEVVGRPVWEVQYLLVAPEHRSAVTLGHIKAAFQQALQTGALPGMNQVVEAQFRRGDGSMRSAEQTLFPTRTAKGFRLYCITRDITARKQAEAEIHRRLAELEAVNQLSTVMRSAQTLDEILSVALETTLAAVHISSGSIWLYDPILDKLDLSARHGLSATGDAAGRLPARPTDRMAGLVLATGQPFVSPEYGLDPRLPETVRTAFPPGVGGAALPLRAGDAMIGIFDVDVTRPRELTPDELHLLTILTEIAGNAIQRTRLHEQTERRLQRLTTLSDIDRAIIGSFDLPRNLQMLLEQVCARLSVDAADVLLFDAGPQILEYAAGFGFRTDLSRHARLSLGQSQAGRAASERRSIHIENLPASPGEFDPVFLAGEEFVEYYAVPLLAKGHVKGVIEVFHRAPLAPDQEWLDFFNALAGQCAIAIDNATLFSGLQRSNTELARAYDATIEGWSGALDLRDRETEGHTRRVTEMTVRLADALSLPDEERVHIRRGALLHDIGKMGIPDSVLLKPGALTEQEWVVMRSHPQLAYDLLSPIDYLGPALDIPYCHHEKWDGTGYPRNLKGEDIPLSARLFAVVDVWDALRSDRPYRPAWEPQRVYEYIQSQSGIHFDPAVVELFLKVIASERG